MNILILEPHHRLVAPYSFLPTIFEDQVEVKRVESIERGVDSLTHTSPELVLVSASFEPEETLSFLEELQQHIGHNLQNGFVPVLFVVDVSSPLSTVLGTAWGGQTGVTSTQASLIEFKSVVMRVVR